MAFFLNNASVEQVRRRSYKKKAPRVEPLRSEIGRKRRSLPRAREFPYSAITLKSQNRSKSPTNEDRYSVKAFQNFVLFSVFDGHSGPAISDYSSLHFLNHLGKNITKKGTDPQVFKEAFLTFDNILHKEFNHKQDGSTVTVIYIDKHKIISANAGDSVAYLVKRSAVRSPTASARWSPTASARWSPTASARCAVRSPTASARCAVRSPTASARCAVRKLTTEHDYSNEKERKRVIAAGGKFHSGYYTVGNYMLQPTRGFGDFIFKKSKGNRGQDIYTALPTVREYPIGPSDKFVILATDGILLGNPNEPQNTIATLCGGAQNRAAQQAPASKRLLTGILNSTEIFGNPIYYPDDVTIIAVDLTVLRRRICAQRILRLVPKSI